MMNRSVASTPVAHTPPGGYGDVVPEPVLAGCVEPLVAGAPDLRGWWRVVEVLVDGQPVAGHAALGHVQRVEQAGNRLVVTGGGIVHDMRCDGTVEHGVHDVAELDKATSITVVATYGTTSTCYVPSASRSRSVDGVKARTCAG